MEKTPKDLRNDALAKQVVASLEARHFEAHYCPTAQEAVKKALEIIPEGSSITAGGSMTVKDSGLWKALGESGKYNVIDRENGKTPEEVEQILRQAFTSDYYLMSANGISEDGVIVNIDGKGNRVAALCFGPKNVLMLISLNKVMPDTDSAYKRARFVAAPINQNRFRKDTPCTSTGKCHDCKSLDCICNQIVFTRQSKPAKRIKVILIGEDFGY